MRVVLAALCSALLFSGCAYRAQVPSTSAAYEVRTDKAKQAKAYVYVSQEAAGLEKIVKPGYICSAHTFPVEAGVAVKASIMRTMEAAYKDVVPVSSSGAAKADGPLYSFTLEEFNPRLRFSPGFWTPTADASVEIAFKTAEVAGDGREVARTTVRGFGQDSQDGSCSVGADVLAAATEKAIRVALENFVGKVINPTAP